MWPAPAGEKRDVFFQDISLRLAKLRAAEPADRAYATEVRAIFDTLVKRKDFVADRDLWVELYYMSTRLYPHIRSLAGVPFVNTTKHNHVMQFYMRLDAPARMPLVHWDTHSDLNAIADSNDMIEAMHHGDVTSVQNACHDIGAAMTGVLLLPGPPRNMVWVTPSWVPDPEDDVRYWKHRAGSKNTVLAHCDRTRDHPVAALRLYPRSCPCAGPSGTISTINLNTGPREQKLRRLLTLVPPGPFLLDVDLDAFVCNGKPMKRSLYLRDGYDVCSTDRARMKELNDRPREMFDKKARQYYDLSRSFRKETRLIEGRLRAFERQLRYLCRRGRRPYAISISDSTGVNFTDCTSCAATGNQYMPTYYAAFVNQKVITILHRLLSECR